MAALDNFFRNTWNSQRPHYYCRDLTTASLYSQGFGGPPPLLGPLEQHLLQQVRACVGWGCAWVEVEVEVHGGGGRGRGEMSACVAFL